MTVTADGRLILDVDAQAAMRGIGDLTGSIGNAVSRLADGAGSLTDFSEALSGVSISANGGARAIVKLGGVLKPVANGALEIAQAFAVGGPVGAAFASLSIAGSVLTSVITDMAKAEQLAFDNAVKLGREIGQELVDAVRSGEESLRDAQTALENFGLSASEVKAKAVFDDLTIAIDKQDAAFAEDIDLTDRLTEQTNLLALSKKVLLETGLNESGRYTAAQQREARKLKELLPGEIKDIKDRRDTLLSESSARQNHIIPMLKEELAARQALIDANEKAAAERKPKPKPKAKPKIDHDAVAAERKRLSDNAAAWALADKNRAAMVKAERDAYNLVEGDKWDDDKADTKAALARRKEFLREEARLEKEARTKKARDERAAARERTRLEKEELRERQADVREYIETIGDLYMSLADAAFNAIESFAAGEEIRLIQMGAAFLRTEGTKIIGIGIRTLAEAGASGVTVGGQPAALAQAAMGTTIVALGTAMGGAGAALTGLDRAGAFGDLGVIPGASDVGGGGGGSRTSDVGGGQFDSGPSRGNVPIVYNVTFASSTIVGNPNESVSHIDQLAHQARYDQFGEA